MSEEVCFWLASQQDAMLAMMEKVVNIDSGSYDKAGVDAVGEVFADFFRSHDIDVERLPSGNTAGDIFRASIPGSGNAPIVLMGHRDTVFAKGEAARRPFTVKDGRAYGPGVMDMKGGLVLNAYVLVAFKKFGGNPAPLVALLTSDEEIASPHSRRTIEDTARGARAVYNAEPGRASGNVVSGRKGGIFMVMDVEGKAAHSGVNFQDGHSAIHALAHKTVEIAALTDLSIGLTLNIGLISGGQSVNTVAPSATGEIDMRYVRHADRDRVIGEIERIVGKEHVAGTLATLRIKGEFLPFEQTTGNASLLSIYQKAARLSGLTLEGEFTGGCADSGFTSAIGTPTLCGTGPVGGKAHSPEEYLEVDSIVPRAQSLARAVAATAPLKT
ncbi:M20 family metallopeptidase [Bradyrhizobium sp. SYSU BS000235]|uniref:M20 family metallopeptidase n=1 Tax=Bradyrhizobium sp. SYSU BS000235 TaxID=3411332 RepID=UPI003C76059E